MKQIEHATGLPIGQLVHPVQIGLGSIILLASVTIAGFSALS